MKISNVWKMIRNEAKDNPAYTKVLDLVWDEWAKVGVTITWKVLDKVKKEAYQWLY